jgi:hypothetical protein
MISSKATRWQNEKTLCNRTIWIKYINIYHIHNIDDMKGKIYTICDVQSNIGDTMQYIHDRRYMIVT